ncbi:Cullin-3 [Smittium culicis]|uniref:Cullin-3 n=1 Tax=Smittium culicis TaxID=133412 RepID=A0A1R1XPA1_9FUNG|nr:Cullin-3 [Smittium culicis]
MFQANRNLKNKPIKPATKLTPRKSNQELIDTICSAIADIYKKKASTLSYEELYRSTYNLDKVYVKAERKLSIYDSSLNIFNTSILIGPDFNLLSTISPLISQSILYERQGLSIDRPALKNIISMTMEIYNLTSRNSFSLFESNIKPLILSTSHDYYKKQANKYTHELGIVYFAKQVEKFKKIELDRCHDYLHNSLIQEIESVINIELVDSFANSSLDKSEAEAEKILDMIITLFRFLKDKDIFEVFIRQHLLKRLLSGRIVSFDVESSFISKLKNECGSLFTLKLEGLLKDYQLSQDLEAEIANSEGLKTSLSQLSVSIFNPKFYPIHSSPTISSDEHSTAEITNFPIQIENLKNSFNEFYGKKFNGRKLSWQYNMGSCDVVAKFKDKTIELNVSTVIIAILLLFNDSSDNLKLSYEEIKQRIQIPDIDLIRNLQSVACAKYKILNKTPKSAGIFPGDIFEFNNDFTCPTRKLKIPLIAASSSSKINSQNQANQKANNKVGLGPESGLDEASLAKLEKSRVELIDAAIVRIMKSRKKFVHSLLVSETISQLQSRFTPSPTMIKHRIDELIDKGYIERNSEDRNTYNYIS